MTKKRVPKMTSTRIKFLETYGEFDEAKTLHEILFAQQLQIKKLERIRSNTSILVWWLVAIPIVIFLIALISGINLF